MTGTLTPWLEHPLDAFRYLTERYLIVPAAEHMPLRVAMFIADLAALADCLIPSGTWRTARAEVSAARPSLRRWRSARLLVERLAAPRRELVWLTRMRAGREHPAAWKVVEIHRERVRCLIENGAPFVIADGHFSSAAIALVQQVLPTPVAFVAGAAPTEANTPRELRRRLTDQSRDSGRIGFLAAAYPADRLFIGVPDTWGPEPGWGHPRDRTATVRAMLQRLKEPGGMVLVRIDAIWGDDSGFVRLFAGDPSRNFALGAATVARLAACPLVPFVAFLDGRRRTVTVHWGSPIPPAPRRDATGDAANLSRALDFLERAIGQRPAQYLADVGQERRWDSAAQSWS